MKQETYKSSTHGPIPLSFTGRRLLENLRHAITAAIAARDWNHDNNAVSKARGELAKYMSRLENDRATANDIRHSWYRVVRTSNYDSTYFNQSFVETNLLSEDAARKLADTLNEIHHKEGPYYWKVVPANYILPKYDPNA